MFLATRAIKREIELPHRRDYRRSIGPFKTIFGGRAQSVAMHESFQTSSKQSEYEKFEPILPAYVKCKIIIDALLELL
jgi:hypothetical protein